MPVGACLQRALDQAAADAGGGEHGLAWHLAGPSKPAPCWTPWGPSRISAAWIGACVHTHTIAGAVSQHSALGAPVTTQAPAAAVGVMTSLP